MGLLSVGPILAEKLHIIWLMAEDPGLDLECHGSPDVKTPGLNTMVKEGTLYKQSTAPTRFAHLTQKNPVERSTGL